MADLFQLIFTFYLIIIIIYTLNVKYFKLVYYLFKISNSPIITASSTANVHMKKS